MIKCDYFDGIYPRGSRCMGDAIGKLSGTNIDSVPVPVCLNLCAKHTYEVHYSLIGPTFILFRDDDEKSGSLINYRGVKIK